MREENMKKLLALILSALLSLSVITAIAEEDVYSDTSNWKIECSSQISESRGILKAFDSDESTIWHSAYEAEGSEIVSQDKPPYTITVTFDKALSVTGVRYIPRQISSDDDSSVGIWQKAEFYGSADGKSYKKIGEKTYSDISETRLSEDTAVSKGSYKSIKIIVKAAKDDFGTAAEIKFLTGSVKETKEPKKEESELVSTADAVITASSQRSETVKQAFDSDKTTYWHSNYTDENGIVTSTDPAPYMIGVTFPAPVLISGFTYLPRQDATSGRFSEAELYVSDSESGELTLLKTLEYGADAGEKKTDFGANIQVRRIGIKITKSGGVATAAEFGFIKGKDSYKTIKTQDFAAHEEATKLYKIDSSAFTVTSDKKHWLGYVESNVTDSSKTTFWQTESGEEAPFTLTVDMKKAYTVREFTYTPRPTDDFHGSWLEFRVESSDNGTDFEEVLSVTGWKEGADEKRVAFPEPVTARCIRFVITKGYTGRAAAADISFYQSKEDSEKNNEPSEKYVLKIGSNEIEAEKGGQKSNVTIDVAPYIDPSSSSTLIPLRGLLEQMGAKVTWDGETEGIIIDSGSGKIKMQIQNSLVYADHPVYGTVRYTLAVVPKIRNSRTFIPLRFVSEQLGYNVEWDGASRTITITK